LNRFSNDKNSHFSSLSRRQFLQSASLYSAGILIPGVAFAQGAQQRNPLKIPDQLLGTQRNGQSHYSLNVQAGTSEFIPGLRTPSVGYNGDYLGPTLRFKQDDNISMHIRNQLEESTTVHWHGLHVPAKADGGPAQVIKSGDDWNPEFKIMQRGGTYWYHSHALNRTGDQVYRGMSGLIIIDDEDNQQSGLPSEYGVDDIPLIVQDRQFNEDGTFRYIGTPRDIMTGMFGNTVLVNGTLSAEFNPKTELVRFRLLNGSNARTYSFAFDDQRTFKLVASDGGLLSKGNDQSTLVLAPSERAEILVDFSDGNPVNLISLSMPDSSPFSARGMMSNMHPMNQERMQILAIEPQSNLSSSETVRAELSTIQRIDQAEAVRTRSFTLSMAMGMGMMGRRGGRGRMGGGESFFINGEVMDMNRVAVRIRMGDTEIWEVTNDSMMMHPFHVHFDQFQILDRNGRPPSAEEMGFKDSVKIGPDETVRFIMRFNDFSDADTAYMYHCHILEHEDNGMMGQFTVT